MNTNVYMLNTKTFTWLTSYTPTYSEQESHADAPSIGIIIGIISTVIAFTVIMGIVGMLLYKKYKRRHERDDVIPTPGSNMREEGEYEGERRERTSHTPVIITDDNMTNTNNYRNSSNTDVTVISHSRPSSTYKG